LFRRKLIYRIWASCTKSILHWLIIRAFLCDKGTVYNKVKRIFNVVGAVRKNNIHFPILPLRKVCKILKVWFIFLKFQSYAGREEQWLIMVLLAEKFRGKNSAGNCRSSS